MALPELVRLRPLTAKGGFSLDPRLIREIFRHAKPLGHHHAADTLNLGFGFIYYGLVRALRPKYVVVIGSGFGFSVVCLALGLKDNAKGKLDFIDPSYSVLTDGVFKTVGGTAQWSDPDKVRRHFARFGVEDWVNHHQRYLAASAIGTGFAPIPAANVPRPFGPFEFATSFARQRATYPAPMTPILMRLPGTYRDGGPIS